MPHLQIQYSSNLEQRVDVDDFCRCMAEEIADIGLYPLGGIRVRAYSAKYFAIADLHEKNKFVDMVFRIGQGRSAEEKKLTGTRLMALAEAFFAQEKLHTGYFMLSLEIVEIQSTFSWKTNSVHQRINQKKNNGT